MKKLSLIILSFAIIFTGFFVSACGSKSEGKITLSQENVVLYLGENEDNSVTINAKVEGIKVERLRLYYDNSNINIKSSSKKEDNSFDLTIKAITTLSVDPIQVRVEASKDVTAVFYVEVSLPLTSISVQENLYIPYSGNDVEFNLNDKLIFTPQGTKQTDVFYEFIDNQPEGVEIVDGILKIAAAEYIYSSAPIKIKVQSAEVGKSAIMNQFEVFVLQNVKAYANEIVFETNYNGSINEMNSSNFELKIEDKTLSVFDIFVKIPKELGISVELDSKRTSYEAGNILDIIDCSTLSYVEGEFSVHKFIFSTTKQLSGNGNLYFNFFYENYKSDERLNSSFVKVKNANNYDLIDCLGIDVVIPIKGIFVKTSCITNVNGNYIIYKNYNTTTMQYGTEFSFGADPVNTTQTQLSIIKLSANLDVYRVNGTKVLEGETILVNEKLYIKGNSRTPESAYLGNIFKVESGLINKEIKFDISSGATMFGFVSNAGDTNAKATTDIAVEQGDESNFYIYAPGASLSDIVYDSSVMEFLREGDWFVGLVKGVEIGKKAYAISTNNGFTITLNLTTIARINNVIIQLKEGTTAGVGKVSTEGYLSFALKYGYSVELEYMVGDNSEIAKINYYFYDTMIDETRDAYDEYAVSPEELIESDYELYSNVVNTQNLVQQNLVTGKTEGRTIIKVEVVGQKVENGVILEDVQEVQYILIEVYKPTTFIDANQKVITLRSQDQVDELYYDTTVYTIPLVAKSNATEDSTYYQLYLDGGLYQTKTEIVDGVEVTVRETIFEYSDFYGKTIIEATLNHETRELTIKALSYIKVPVNILIYAVDFESIETLKESDGGLDFFSKNKENAKNAVALNLTINIENSILINDIEVSNFKLETETETEKIYEEIYVDTSKLEATGDNFIKINTEVYPLNAFDKRLSYSFVANAGYSNNMVDISSNDGIVRIPGTVGGTGYIVIKPTYGKSTVKTVKIPIVIADGNSYETAYRITSLNEIRNANKHYILTEARTYSLTYTLFNGTSFNGGLYGCLNHDYNKMATISLKNCSLFDVLGSTAVIEGLYLFGTTNNRGFVANENNGKILNVEVTTLIKNAVYIPSLINYKGTESVGGIVGTNNGTIENCIFAGSVNAENAEKRNALVGTNNGAVTGGILYVAKFETNENAYLLGENTFINGNLNADNAMFDDQTDVDTIDGGVVVSYSSVKFDATDMFIKTTNGHSIGQEGSIFGILMYYKSEIDDENVQNILNPYNIISFGDLFNSNNTEFNDKYIKVMVFEEGSNISSNKIISNAGSITIGGTGQYNLKVYSKLDYTQYKIFNIYTIYYFEELKISYAGEIIEAPVSMKSNSLQQIETSTSTIIIKDEQEIKLKENNFNIQFTFNYEDEEGNNQQEAGANYISGQQVGKHFVNVSWNWDVATTVTTTLQLNIAQEFNNLINSVDSYKKSVIINKALGTTRIDLDKSEATIEPKDVLTFEASIITDNEYDIIDRDTITIASEYGKNCTESFDINVVKDENSNKYVITLSLKDDFKGLSEYVGVTYLIKVQSKDTTTLTVYDCYNIIRLTVLPQTISSVNTTIYRVSEQTPDGVYVNSLEAPTSVIKPLDQALLIIDLFPEYAYFDHIDIIARSSNQTKLYFSPQKHSLNADGKLLPNNYEYDKGGKFDAIADVNGMRLQNNFNNPEQIHGQYAIMLHSNSKVLEETIYYIDINIYDKEGNKSDQSKTILLYVKMPPAPEVSINGETFVYAEIGETLVADVSFANNQMLANYNISYLEENNNVNANDFIKVEKYDDKEVDGVKKCKIAISIPSDYKLDSNNNDLVLSVNSTIVDKGQTISRTSKAYITIIDFKMKDNCVSVDGVVDGKLNITSLQAKELKLNVFANIAENVNSAIDAFRNNYYFNGDSGFEVGSIEGFDANDETKTATQGRILATYLSFKRGDVTYPIAKFNDEGILEIAKQDINSYLDYAKFIISSDGTLYVQGGDFVGEVPMVLSFNYKMPNGSVFTYEYNFTMVNALYTTEDLPKEVANANDFMDIALQETAQDYILSRDIYLYEYEVINNTSKIKSLDGNNYTIHIMSFNKQVSGTVNYALFNTISEGTTIRNLTVNYYYMNTIDVDMATLTLNIAGFAITNNGIITNCDVAAYYNPGDVVPTFKNYGIKLDIPTEYNVQTTIAGFVIYNNSAITNSRVGADTKTITSIKYNSDGTYKVNSTELTQKAFTIRGEGNIAGFVFENNSVITSSFVKNVSIINTYNKQETKRTSGFVDTNNGQISLSYVEGIRDSQDVQITQGGIEGTGILSGFVYLNNSVIYDSYSNIMVKSLNDQVGRLGAGFVYSNSEKASISKSYSFSKVLDGTVTQTNFAGITLDLQYNNLGIIDHCYYYASTDDYVVSIENLYNTNINYVKNVNNVTNFYGFAFNVNKENSGTWRMEENGPKLVSANNIATSFRYKVDDKNASSSTVAYKFLYANGYEYGTSKNPVIIRNAQEFNNVLGNGTGSEYTNNFTSTKIYGAYRLVNNIDLLELVVDETINTEYKYNLKSTQLTLTGENTELDGRNGSFDGNGLTIAHLAISNNKTATDNYGLFKSVESGAKITNLNITIDKGGVVANNTINVGVIAGTVKDSQLININIVNSNKNQDNPFVIGSNLVGGVAGRVIGNSYVANITVEDINVTASYFDSVVPNSDFSSLANEYKRTLNEQEIKKLSIAGGAFGVIEIEINSEQSDNNSEQAGDREITSIKEANVLGIEVKGSMEVYGKTVGGIIGSAGEFVIGRNLTLTLLKSDIGKQAKLIAYNCYAGGIVGFSRGNLYQIKAVHETPWQTEIENNMNSYYIQDGSDSVDRGNISLFELEEDYKPSVIGGLVGVMKGGRITTAYTKLNVTNKNAKVVGGAVGLIVPTGEEKNESNNMELLEVYTIGDIYALNASINSGVSYIGGLIGLYNLDSFSSLSINLCNALNYYSLKTYEDIILNADDVNIVFDSLINKHKNSSYDADVKIVATLNEVQFEKNTSATQLSSKIEEKEFLNSYYSYLGVRIDDGAQIDQIFKLIGWYDGGNWTRDINEMFPHIIYTQPVNIHEINTTADFEKFNRYGSDPNAIFVVMKDTPINCSSISTSYNNFRGTLRGLYPGKSGFEGLKQPLFSTTYGANIADLQFVECTSAIVAESDNTNYKNLKFESCSLYRTETKDSKISIAGIAYFVSGSKTTFDLITFSNCTIYSNDGVNYAGYLFGSATSGTVTITNVDVLSGSLGLSPTNGDELYLNAKAESSIGKLFGYSSGEVSATAISIADSVRIKVALPQSDIAPVSEESSEASLTTSAFVGLIGGRVDGTLTIANYRINIATTLPGIEVGVATAEHSHNNSVYLGGLVGSAGTLNIQGDNKTISSNITLTDRNNEVKSNSSEKLTTKSYKTAYVGGLAGFVGNINTQNLTDMALIDNEKENEHPNMNVLLASENSFIGGMFGSVQTGTISNLTYNGNIIFQEVYGAGGETYANIGGIVGEAQESIIIENTNFAGTISTSNDSNKGEIETYKLGGIVGVSAGSIKLEKVISIGDILIDNAINNSYAYNNIKANLIYAGGLVGQNNNNVEMSNIIALTTIYSLYTNETLLDAVDKNIGYYFDALVNTSSGKTTTSLGNVKYASNITLCVSSLLENITNENYGKVLSSSNAMMENYLDLQAFLGEEEEGSKINPKTFSYDLMLETAVGKYKVEFADVNDETKITYSSEGRRKLYLWLNSENIYNSDNTAKQIELKNAFMFSDGYSITTTVTPFDSIDSRSAVSGVISKIYSVSHDNSFAGFANTNKGVVYTAIAQEVLLDTIGNSEKTQFYGYLKIKETTNSSEKFVGGFVGSNFGYIFGSNSNLIIEAARNKVGGFVGSNSGYIEYSYANGIINQAEQVDLFASESTGEIINKSCYTLVANKTEVEEQNKYSVLYSVDASETMLDADGKMENLFGIGTLADAPYYDCLHDFNYNYPSLSAKQFLNVNYISRKTVVTAETNYDPYLGETAGSTTNYKNEVKRDENSTWQVPNIEVFKALGGKAYGNQNYVLIRELDFSYITEGIKETLCVAQTQSFTFDGYSNSLSNISLVGKAVKDTGNNTIFTDVNVWESLPNGTIIKNININNLYLTKSSGVIGKNNGLLQNISIIGTLKLEDLDIAQTAGCLVGDNQASGIVKNCVLALNSNTTVSIGVSDVVTFKDITFGGIVGSNSGNIELSTIMSGSVLELNHIKHSETITFGGIVGKNTGTIKTSGLDLNTKIAVKNAGNVIVGGVVGLNTGIIEECYTLDGVEIEAGEEISQLKSIAGGIAGSTSGGTISNCANEANVKAFAKWQLANKNTGEIETNYSETNTYYEYYYNENVEKPENTIYIYQHLKSDATAGGIYGTGNPTIETLVNKGKVEGGFMAWKPVATVMGNEEWYNYWLFGTLKNSFYSITAGAAGFVAGLAAAEVGAALGTAYVAATSATLGTSATAAATSSLATSASTIMSGGSVAGPIGIVAALVITAVVVGVSIYHAAQEKEMMSHIPVYITPIKGNSDLYIEKSDFITQTGDKTFDTGFFQNTTINQYGKAGDLVNKDILNTTLRRGLESNDNANIQKFTNLNVFGGDGIKGIKEVSVHEPIIYGGIEFNHPYPEAIDYDVDVYFDSISPDLKMEDKGRVYSSRGTFIRHSRNQGEDKIAQEQVPSTTELRILSENAYECYTLNLSSYNPDHVLRYNLPNDKKYVYSSMTNIGVGNDTGVWYDDGTLTTSSPLKFNPKYDELNKKFIFEVADTRYWKNVAYTINNFSAEEGEYSGSEYRTITENIIIQVNINPTSKQYISVGSYGLDVFNGTIEVLNDNIYFQNLTIRTNEYKLNDDESKSYYYNLGFIKESDGAEFKNVKFHGDVVVKGNDLTDYTSTGRSLGLFIGQASGVTIENSIFDWNIISIGAEFQNIGAVIGTIKDDSSLLSNVKVEVKMLEYNQSIDIELKKNFSFGGIIGNVAGNVTLKDSDIKIENAKFVSDINCVGGAVGINDGNLSIENITSNINLIAIARQNTYVGGIVGYTSGTTIISGEININTSETGVISADVGKVDSTPYAGGVIGYVAETAREQTTVGAVNVGTENNNIGENDKNNFINTTIMVGYNNYVDNETFFIVPNNAYAGYVYGNENKVPSGSVIKNTIVKVLAIKNNSNANKVESAVITLKDKNIFEYKKGDLILINNVKTDNFVTYVQNDSVVNEFDLVYSSNIQNYTMTFSYENDKKESKSYIETINTNGLKALDKFKVRVVYINSPLNNSEDVLVQIFRTAEIKSTNDSNKSVYTISYSGDIPQADEGKEQITTGNYYYELNEFVNPYLLYSKKINLNSLQEDYKTIPTNIFGLQIKFDTILGAFSWECGTAKETYENPEGAYARVSDDSYELNVSKDGTISLIHTVYKYQSINKDGELATIEGLESNSKETSFTLFTLTNNYESVMKKTFTSAEDILPNTSSYKNQFEINTTGWCVDGNSSVKSGEFENNEVITISKVESVTETINVPLQNNDLGLKFNLKDVEQINLYTLDDVQIVQIVTTEDIDDGLSGINTVYYFNEFVYNDGKLSYTVSFTSNNAGTILNLNRYENGLPYKYGNDAFASLQINYTPSDSAVIPGLEYNTAKATINVSDENIAKVEYEITKNKVTLDMLN